MTGGWLVAGGPVIPNFGHGSACERNNGWFCTDWLRHNWGGTLQPALVQHIELTLIAVGIGFSIASVLALYGRARLHIGLPEKTIASLKETKTWALQRMRSTAK